MRRERWLAWVLAACFGAIYLCTLPVNRSEAEDAYMYAYDVETKSIQDLLHPHHLLYGPIAKSIYDVSREIGLAERALPVLVGLSLFSGICALALFSLLLGRYGGIGQSTALPLSACLGASYGFWRYSVEAEIYLPVTAITLAACVCLAPGRRSTITVIGGLVLAALAPVTHILALLPVGIALPLCLLRYGHSRRAMATFASVVGVAFLVYLGVAFSGNLNFGFGVALTGATVGSSSVGTRLLHGLVAFGQTLVSGNFLFGWPIFSEWIHSRFPSRMFAEEDWLGGCMSRMDLLAAWGSLVVLCLVALGVAIRACFSRIRDARGADPSEAAHTRAPLLFLATVWLAAHALLLFVVDPGNPENWIMVAPAAFLLIGASVPRDYGRPLWALALALAVHNYTGGLRLLQDADGDYNQMKADWLIEKVETGDYVVTAGGPVFERYLRYHTREHVEPIYRDPDRLRDEIAATISSGERVWMTGDVLEDLPSHRREAPLVMRDISTNREWLRARCVIVRKDGFGGVYQVVEHIEAERGAR
ncbi:MAG: hypothetical protein O2923_05340 [Verrucomicrobia bacterium]|nr:hypothetical protein [Verrucomicrobiota bacterium]MDA1087544.1 hypothetical protein [Verrucomicrobiota bacterium]